MPPRGPVPFLAWLLAAVSLLAVFGPGAARVELSGPAAASPRANQEVRATPLPPLGRFSLPHSTPARTAAAVAEKVAIFGVDAGDWRVIDRLVASGQLPTFGRLKQVASIGTLRADPPLLSPIIWTTIATGRRPEDHGVLDFMVDLPGGGQAPVNGGSRRVKALWEIWSDAGRSVLVAGWWATWPADHVRGLLISDRLATPHVELALPDAGLVYPEAMTADVTRLVVTPASIDYRALSNLIPLTRDEFARAEQAARESVGRLYQDRVAHFRAALASTRTYRRVSTEFIRSVRPDLWAAYYEVVDTASHLFSADPPRRERAIAAAYREVDQALADSARTLDPRTLVLVVSDHGFEPPEAGVREDPADLTAGATAWHRPYGIIAATTAGVLAGTAAPPTTRTPLGIVSPLDIAPTLLARAGLPIAADMPGRVIPGLAPAAPAARVASYGSHVLPEMPAAHRSIASAELSRLRALGYVSGAAATTSLARVNLGEILFREGDLQGSARELDAVLRSNPLDERAALWLARAYTGLGRRDEALRIYDRLIQAAATTSFALDPIVVLAATDLDIKAGRLGAARTRLGRLPPTTARSPEVLVAAAALADAEGNPAASERSYRAALAASPADFEALERLMDLLLRQKRAAEAASLTFAAARSYPASPQHLSLAGECALATRRYAEAVRFFSAALNEAPDAAEVRLDLARAQLLAGNPRDALATLADLPPSRESDMLRGAAHAAARDWSAAIASYDRALAAGGESADVLNALAAAQLEAGRAQDAVRSLERSLALDPNQPAAKALLARARPR